MRDLLIAGLGDSVAAGEGNPDRPIALADEGFCFRRFLGAARGEYFRPSRAGLQGRQGLRRQSTTGSADLDGRLDQPRRALDVGGLPSLALRLSASHRARARHREQAARRHLPAARLQRRDDRERPVRPAGRQRLPAARPLRRQRAAAARSACRACSRTRSKTLPGRKLDLVLLTIGANDIKFAGLVADVIISAGVERTLFKQGGLLTTVAQAQTLLDRDFPANFAKLRTALKPLVGGNLSQRRLRVLRPSGDAGGDAPCPGGRDGLDVHPAFNADPARLQERDRLRAEPISAEGEGAGALRGRRRNAPIPTPTA